MAGRLRTGLGNRMALGVVMASVLLGVALMTIPSLAPWQGRATWVIGWGVLLYLAIALATAWSSPQRHHPLPSPVPSSAPSAVLPPVPPPVPTPPPTAARNGAGPYPDGLTAREVEVLRLLAGGKTNREIAAALVVSVPTAERHIANIYAKISTRGRAEATAYALRHGLME